MLIDINKININLLILRKQDYFLAITNKHYQQNLKRRYTKEKCLKHGKESGSKRKRNYFTMKFIKVFIKRSFSIILVSPSIRPYFRKRHLAPFVNSCMSELT